MTDQSAETTTSTPVGRLASVSLDCPDPATLAAFYGRLLGLRQLFATPDGSLVSMSDGTMALTMMRIENYVAPTWPHPGQLQQMHLDILVTDLEPAVATALELGARQAEHQAAPHRWRVLIDPAGHPFCLTTVTGD